MTDHPMRHPVTGRFMAGDCERDCLEHCAGLCGVFISDEVDPIVTKTGKVLTDADIEALADEAERGYCVTRWSRWGPGNGTICGLAMPCPLHASIPDEVEERLGD